MGGLRQGWPVVWQWALQRRCTGLGPFGLVPGVGDLQEHVGVAGLVGWAPAGQCLAGELAAGGVGQLGMLREVLAVQGAGAGLAVLGHAVGVAPAGRAGTTVPGARTATAPVQGEALATFTVMS